MSPNGLKMLLRTKLGLITLVKLDTHKKLLKLLPLKMMPKRKKNQRKKKPQRRKKNPRKIGRAHV